MEKANKERTAVESENAYLKQFFHLNNVRQRTGRKAKLYLSRDVYL